MKSTERTWVIQNRSADSVRVVREVLALLEAYGFPKEDLFAIRMGLDEAIANAMKHGNKGDSSKRITISVQMDEEKVIFKIADEGPGFDPDEIPDPTLEENITRSSGRGVLLIRSYMSDVSFNDVGNEICMCRRRTTDSSEGQGG